MDNVPYPRLELRLRNTDEETDASMAHDFEYAWDYVLVVHKANNRDTRCNDNNNTGVHDVEFILNTSYSGGGPERVPGDTPYRDGVHIKWDSEALNVPMYSVVNGVRVKL